MNASGIPPARSLDPLERWEVQIRKGSLELAILAALWPRRRYGLDILRHLADVADLAVPEGTVYPLLSRLKAEGFLESEWVEAEAGHPRKYYRLTDDGRRHAAQMTKFWSRFAANLDALVEPLREGER